MEQEKKTEIELNSNGEVKLSLDEEREPLFEIKGYQPPKSFKFAFSVCLTNTVLLICYPVLMLIFAIIAVLAKLTNMPNPVFIGFLGGSLFCLLASLLMDVVLPLITKKRLSKLPKTDLRFYEGLMEMVTRVETEGKDVGGIKTPIAYSSIAKLKQTSSYVIFVFPFNGKKGTLGIEKEKMPDGLLEFLLKQKK